MSTASSTPQAVAFISAAMHDLAAGTAAGTLLVVPGGWGVTDLTELLAQTVDGPLLRLTWAPAPNGANHGIALAQDLTAPLADPLPLCPSTISVLPERPTLLIERASDFDAVSVGPIVTAVREGVARLVVCTASASEVPAALIDLWRSGALTLHTLPTSTLAELAEASTRLLGAAPTALAVSRLLYYSGGHPMLLPRVLVAAKEAEALVRGAEQWEWELPRESDLRAALGSGNDDVTAALPTATRRPLLICALAGALPERAARALFGRDTIDDLRRHGLLRLERFTAGSARSLTVKPQLLSLVLRHSVLPGERSRLWYSVGQQLGAGDLPPLAEVGLACWRAEVERVLPEADALRLTEIALGSGQFAAATRILDAIVGGDSPLRQVLAARADAALGDIDDALAGLSDLAARAVALAESAEQIRDTDDTEAASVDNADAGTHSDTAHAVAVLDALHDAALLAARIAIFHPRATTVLRALSESSARVSATLPLRLRQTSPQLVTALLAGGRCPSAEVLRQCLGSDDQAEEMTAMLWLGARLSFLGDPHSGRQVLLGILDDGHRERGLAEYIEPAAAMLILLQEQHAWKPAHAPSPIWSREYELDHSPRLATVGDLMSAVSSSRVGVYTPTLQRACSALRTLAVRDPFGLAPFAYALAASLHANAPQTAELAPLPDTNHTRRGFWPLDYVRLGLLSMRHSGFGEEGAATLLALAERATADGYPALRLEMLFMALTTGSETAAREVLAARGAVQTSRTAIITRFAEALLTDTPPDSAFALVRTLLSHDTTLMALQVLSSVWPRFPDRSPHRRVAVQLAAELSRSIVAQAWIDESFIGEIRPSEREHRILEGLRSGATTRTIAAHLQLSPRTIEGHISQLLARYGCANRMELIDLELPR